MDSPRPRFDHALIGIERFVGNEHVSLHGGQKLVGSGQIVKSRRRSDGSRPGCRGHRLACGSWCLILRASDRSPGSPRLFWGAGAMLVGAHDGAVDHRVFVVGIGSEMLEDPLPDAGFRPAAEVPVNVAPLPEALRQVAPRNPSSIPEQHRLDKQLGVTGQMARLSGASCRRSARREWRRPRTASGHLACSRAACRRHHHDRPLLLWP